MELADYAIGDLVYVEILESTTNWIIINMGRI